MSSSQLPVSRIATVVSVACGFALIGASAGGVVAMDSQLRAATEAPPPTRLVGERPVGGPHGDWRCPRRDTAPPAWSPEV